MIADEEIRAALHSEALAAPPAFGDLAAVARNGRRRRVAAAATSMAAGAIVVAGILVGAVIAFGAPEHGLPPAQPPADAYFPVPRWLPDGLVQVEGAMSIPDPAGRTIVNAALADPVDGSLGEGVTVTVWDDSVLDSLPPGVDFPLRSGHTLSDPTRTVRIADFGDIDPSFTGAVVEWVENGRHISVDSPSGDLEAALSVARGVGVDGSGLLTSEAVTIDSTWSGLGVLVAPVAHVTRPMPYVLATIVDNPAAVLQIEMSDSPAGVSVVGSNVAMTTVRGSDAYVLTASNRRSLVFSLASGVAVWVESQGGGPGDLLSIDSLRRIAENLDFVDRATWVGELHVDGTRGAVLPTTTTIP
jgi:hypothetical protein